MALTTKFNHEDIKASLDVALEQAAKEKEAKKLAKKLEADKSAMALALEKLTLKDFTQSYAIHGVDYGSYNDRYGGLDEHQVGRWLYDCGIQQDFNIAVASRDDRRYRHYNYNSHDDSSGTWIIVWYPGEVGTAYDFRRGTDPRMFVEWCAAWREKRWRSKEAPKPTIVQIQIEPLDQPRAITLRED